MYTLLLSLLALVSLVLILAILLQAGKGGGLAASFGGMSSSADSLLGTRQAGNLLTKASWWGGGLFLFIAFVLSLMSGRARAPKSVLDQTFQAPAAAPAPVNTAPTNAAPGVPLTPAGGDAKAPAAGTAPAQPAPATKTP